MTICKHNKCTKRAYFGKAGTKNAEYCVEHKLKDYVDVVHKKCLFKDGCTKIPNYGKVGTKKAEYCVDHKLKDYVDVKSKKCLFDACPKIPIFGKVGTKKAEYCVDHKLKDYVDVIHKNCQFKGGCTKRPNFGKVGTTLAEYCVEHKLKDYVDVKSKKCIFKGGCNKRPIFGKVGTKIAEYCVDHKPKEYIDVKDKKCLFKDGCNKIPIFGKVGTNLAEYCADHKLTDYIDVKNKRCLFKDGCNKHPNFGKVGTTLAEYCDKHKLKDYIDVKSKKCTTKNCEIRAWYGILKKEKCAQHREKGMVNNPGAFCKHKKNNKKCKNKSLYGDPLKHKLLYCEDHFTLYNKKNDLYNLTESPCLKCKLTFSLNKDKLCMFCSGYEKKQRVKKYEEQMKQFLEDKKFPVTSCDRRIDINCSLKRPDFIIRGKYQNIILEVDEYQHLRGSYTPECELIKMKQIFMDNGEENLTFIRFNPNTYTNKNNRKIKESMKRYKTLEEYINYCIEEKPTEHCKIYYLYYDGYEEGKEDKQLLNPYN